MWLPYVALGVTVFFALANGTFLAWWRKTAKLRMVNDLRDSFVSVDTFRQEMKDMREEMEAYQRYANERWKRIEDDLIPAIQAQGASVHEMARSLAGHTAKIEYLTEEVRAIRQRP